MFVARRELSTVLAGQDPVFSVAPFLLMIYDDDIMRTVIDMPERELTDLAQLSKEEHISRAEAIRRAVAQYIAERKTTTGDTKVFGLWKTRKTTGLEYEDRVRQEWDRHESRS